MKYTEPSFTLPAAPPKITQREWDYATLTAEEFAKKYGELERIAPN